MLRLTAVSAMFLALLFASPLSVIHASEEEGSEPVSQTVLDPEETKQETPEALPAEGSGNSEGLTLELTEPSGDPAGISSEEGGQENAVPSDNPAAVPEALPVEGYGNSEGSAAALPEPAGEPAVTSSRNSEQETSVIQAEPGLRNDEEPSVGKTSDRDGSSEESSGELLRSASPENPLPDETENGSDDIVEVSAEEPSLLLPSETEIKDETVYVEGATYIRGLDSSYGDIPIYFHYSDDYFKDRAEVQEDGTVLENAYIYDESLSAMSSTLALSSWPSRYGGSSSPERSRNAQELLRQLGFEDIETNEAYTGDAGVEGVMLISARKKVVYDGKEYTLIAILPDSGTQGYEWPTNVELGAGEYHSGFYHGATSVYLPYLSDYINNHGITGDVKLWGSGMSRAAGISNIAGGLLDLAIDNGELDTVLSGDIHLDKKNIYIYTFGCPATVSKDIIWMMEDGEYTERKHDYDNIHNLRNNFDFVIHAVENEWGMDVFGEQNSISLYGEGMVPEDEISDRIQEMCRQWNIIGGRSPEELTAERDFMTYDPETGLYHYVCEEYRTPVTNQDLERFTNRFMQDIAPLITRAWYNSYIEPMSTIYFGTFYSNGAISAALEEQKERFAEEVKVKTTELFMKGLLTHDFSELANYLLNEVNPLNSYPQLLINAFKATGTPYNYDYETHQVSEEMLDDEVMRKVLQEAGLKAGLGMLDLMARARITDFMAALDIYEAVQVGFDVLSSGHTMSLYYAWSRALDDTTRNMSDIYDRNVTAEDAWGYRMVNLPENGNYCVYVYDKSGDAEGYVLRFTMKDGEYAYGGRTASEDWVVHVGTGDRGNGRVLYLRPDHSYDVVFAAEDETSLDLSIDEFAFHYTSAIFAPVNHVTNDTENGLALSDLVISSEEGRQDRLTLHLGALKRYPSGPEDSTPNQRMMLAAAVSVPGNALADYTVEKALQMMAVSGIDSSLINWTEFRLSGNAQAQFTANASAKEGYAFDGWYFGSELLTTNPVYSAWLSIRDFGKRIVAMYHALPTPSEPSSKSSPKAASSVQPAAAETTAAVYAPVPAQTVRTTRIPNTADFGIAFWLAAFFISITAIAACAYRLRMEDR